MKRLTISIIIIIILSFSFGYYFGTKNKSSNNNNQNSFTYLIGEAKSENSEVNTVKVIFRFDNNDICVESRIVYDFANEELAKVNYEKWKEVELENLIIKDTKVSFSSFDHLNGETKQNVLKSENYTFDEYWF